MPSLRELFLRHVAQTSEMPAMLEVDHAEGIFIYDKEGRRYFDMNSGISVSVLGHRHPKVVRAIKNQVDKYMHTMVYGEHIQAPQVEYASLLTNHLPENLDSVYFVNSGSEAIELAIKLAKRANGRYEIIGCKKAYHGSTQGAEGLRSDHGYSRAFLPLIPGFRHIEFNSTESLKKITEKTSAVIIEPVQAEAGVRIPDPTFLKALAQKCKETGTLLILDEIQTGFGRTGHLFSFLKYDIIPELLLIAKGMGGGMPIGAVVSSKDLLGLLTRNPALGHITTFGGHPVACASAKATLEVLLSESYIDHVEEKEKLIRNLLIHEIVAEIRSSGLMMGVELKKRKFLKHVVQSCRENGLIIDYFLFNDKSFRLYPPLIINNDQIREACAIIHKAFNFAKSQYD